MPDQDSRLSRVGGIRFLSRQTELAKVNPANGNILLYNQASVDAYAQAASGSGGNAKAQLSLANALKSTQPDRASEAYRQYVAMELAYPDWIAADWQSPVGRCSSKR